MESKYQDWGFEEDSNQDFNSFPSLQFPTKSHPLQSLHFAVYNKDQNSRQQGRFDGEMGIT